MEREIYVAERPAALIKSCTECNTGLVDGEPSVAAAVHRAIYETEWGMDCRKCPVFLSMTDKEWEEILNEMDGEE